MERFQQRQRTVNLAPAIVALQRKAEEIRQGELHRIQARLGSLTAEQAAAVEALTRGLVNKFLHPPMQAIKQAAREGDSARLDALCEAWSVSADTIPEAERPVQKSAPASTSEPARAEQTRAAMNLRIGSRGSQLALWQANHIAALLRGEGHIVDIEIIKTTGDRLQEVTFAEVGSKGMFTKEIEEALADGRVDLAVHSLKDLPTELPEPFTLAATPPRVDPRDAFVSMNHASLASLPQGAKVGTSSQRRRAQLKALRPDIDAIEFRGNVDTRSFAQTSPRGRREAILLAAAGLERLGKTDWIRERLDPKIFCPAAGQGSLGIESRKGDDATIEAVSFLDHEPTRFAVTAERAALAALGGGCQVPIGIHCRAGIAIAGSGTRPTDEVFAVVADPATGHAVRIYHSAPRADSDPVALGRLIAKMLLDAGAAPLLEASCGAEQ